MTKDNHEIRTLTPSDAPAFRALRLEGLKDVPEAFTAAYEIESTYPVSHFADRISDNAVLGGFSAAGDLVGIIGLHVPASPRTGHMGEVWGVYVRPDGRGTGLAARMMAAVVALARKTAGLEALSLGVGAYNVAARRTYEKAGFRPVAHLPRLLKVGDRYIDEIVMHLTLDDLA